MTPQNISTDTLVYRIAFSAMRGMTAPLAKELLARVGGEREFFEASSGSLAAVMGCRSRLMDDTLRREALETGEREAAFISSSRVRPVYFTDHDYPARLDGCDDAPAMLYAIGDTDLNDCRVVSVVGTRNATPYGLKFVDNLIRDLAQKVENVIIVSGLAYGTDVAAHRQAMAAGLPTVGVLAHGLTTIYPAVHRNVAADMVNHGGMLLTEYRSDAAVHRGNFLARNRIVAGLSDCVVVAESATKGGALVTAKIAAGYDRDVFALPGRVNDEYSAGCNRLIIDNVASMATSADDIINFMGWPMRPQEGQQSGLKLELSAEQLMVVDYLKRKGEAMLNKMSVDLDRPIAKLMALLVDMEFDGLVVNLPGGRYRLP